MDLYQHQAAPWLVLLLGKHKNNIAVSTNCLRYPEILHWVVNGGSLSSSSSSMGQMMLERLIVCFVSRYDLLPLKDHKCYSMFDLNSRPD